MNPGGEPERDETGLPPVDIDIPDDARELDRDVHAYRRELRAQRRSQRHGRWHRSLRKDGVALPLLACCLILALITGTLLTVFTATSNPSASRLPSSPVTEPARSGAPGMVVLGNQVLPGAVLTVGGSPVPMQSLGRAMLVLVPPGCGCAETFRWLAEVASQAGAAAFVIYTPATKSEVQSLHRGLGRALGERVTLAEETDNVLSPDRVPSGLPAGELTAILVAPDHLATWVTQLSPGDNPAPLLRALAV